ncbi:MAG: prepilin-type N-terminal cleavage/methylation domain-containing protein [Planctomycetes bacterium]|nr:prepilin-type N-terminal cleavage/methylation domain-containing protein [Planctomycetota bacterium]
MCILTGNKGLTLLEILMAVVILLLGLVGILSLFPAGIRSTNESVEERMAAFVADSVKEALNIAARSSNPEDTVNNKPAKLKFTHDGLEEKSSPFEFTLPLPSDPAVLRYFVYTPEGTKELTPDAERTYKPKKIFKLASDTFIKSLYDSVVKGNDPTDPYQQWGYIFTVNRVDDIRPASETGPKFKPRSLYDIKINVYRVPVLSKSEYLSDEAEPRLVKAFVFRLAGR